MFGLAQRDLGGRDVHFEHGEVKGFGVRLYEVLEVLPPVLQVEPRDFYVFE